MDSILNKIDDDVFIEAYHNSSNYTELARKIGYGNTINKSLINKIKNKIDLFSLSQYDTAKALHLYTKGELFFRRENYQSARSSIRKNAIDTYKNSNKPKCCLVCGYSKTYEVAHIKGVSDFDNNTLISEINDISNLVALCPNHHWEYDNTDFDIASYLNGAS